MLPSCSTQKNTGASRAFHNLTSRYNVLFNGTESFKKGMLNLQGSYKDDYAELLPIFLYQDPDQLSSISSDMDRAIKKATKVISVHSITVKPEIKEGQEITEKERDFFSKNEYNKWVDDAYLLLGKAHFYKRELKRSSETFEYLIANFPDDPSIIETKIWLIRLMLENNKLKQAQEYIDELEANTDLSTRLQSELHSTIAQKAIIEEDYQKAISSLKKAVENTNSKYHKQRYTFIIAQLYQKIKQVGRASEYYKAVIKLNPPYEMTFNAKINMALTYETGAGSRRDIERQLQKMLKDDKNIDFQDQIYYAWGNLYFKSGDFDKAIEYYIKSSAATTGNTSQQARTFLTIADIYYNKPKYIEAQSYYDSAVGIIDAGYKNYQIIYAKSISLTNLVTHIQTVELQDSVQILSKLSTSDLNAHIDNIIAKEREIQEEKRIRDLEAQQHSVLSTQQQFELQTKTGSSWYFYNSTSLNLGRQEFKRKWGPRKLEDNWRRKNKSVVSYDIAGADNPDNLEGETKTGAKGAANKFSREYYLVNIPFTDSAYQASHEKIKLALFEMGEIYSNELKDYEKAINSYEDLLKRYPDYGNKLLVYYRLYSIGKEIENVDLVAKYQRKIISEYPTSNYAKALTDPEYFKKVEEESKKVQRIYEQVHTDFEQGRFTQVEYMAKKTMDENPEDELVPQFDYMYTVSSGVSKDTVTFISDLQKLISKYPGTDIADNANLLVKYLQNINPEAAVKQEVLQAVQVYKLNKEEGHLAVISLAIRNGANQMMFNIINFNIDNFEDKDLKVRKYDLGDKSLLTVITFEKADLALEYLKKLESFPELWRDVDKRGAELFVISRSNYETLKKEKKLEQYLLFYKEQY